MGMHLHFVDNGSDAAILEQQLHFGPGHIGCTNVTHQAVVHQRFHGRPGLEVASVVVRHGVGIPGIDRDPLFVVIGKRPMHQVQIEVA